MSRVLEKGVVVAKGVRTGMAVIKPECAERLL